MKRVGRAVRSAPQQRPTQAVYSIVSAARRRAGDSTPCYGECQVSWGGSLFLSYWFSFFILITLLKKYFNLSYWPLWLGGMIGTFLPDIDHVIYVMFLKPVELTSQRVNYLVQRQELKRAVELLYDTRSERVGLIFHTVLFQLIFLVLTFLLYQLRWSI